MATMLQFAQKNVNSWKNRNLQRTAQQREDSSSVVSGKTKVRFTTFSLKKTCHLLPFPAAGYLKLY
jgi:hypothetical protein